LRDSIAFVEQITRRISASQSGPWVLGGRRVAVVVVVRLELSSGPGY
jgi:hypothetical protein